MRIMILGSGGREHAIALGLKASPGLERLYCVPGNPGIAEVAVTAPIALEDHKGLLAYARAQRIDLVIVGPEQPLVDGIADRFMEAGIKVFGPTSKAARLEGSKIFSKEFMVRHGIRTAPYGVFSSKEAALDGLEAFTYPLVIKVDGLAAGKGVLIPRNREEAVAALIQIFDERRFSQAGDRILVEAFVQGFEASILCLVDHETLIPLESARDYKKALEGDQGLNTGGMGAISPNDTLTPEIQERIKEEVLDKTLKGLKEEGLSYTGVLFIGLMIDGNHTPHVLEYNVRFGDPETQSVLPRLKTDFMQVVQATVDNQLSGLDLSWREEMALTVIVASAGYPESYEKGVPIGIEALDEGIVVYHSGTRLEAGELVTAGGRVLGITGLGLSLEELREKVYRNLEGIHFKGMHFRRDIGL
ncbi:MAG: phosphoribosylamine--glycine ligase [delta proteobacterium ML8_F1]|nr:MAG: phosphoribosylamine--glycine ligase [delta proteobacterium ML8_F1]